MPMYKRIRMVPTTHAYSYLFKGLVYGFPLTLGLFRHPSLLLLPLPVLVLAAETDNAVVRDGVDVVAKPQKVDLREDGEASRERDVERSRQRMSSKNIKDRCEQTLGLVR